MNNSQKALELLKNALDIISKDDRRLAGELFYVCGSIYCDLKDYSKAIEYTQKALKIVDEIDYLPGKGDALFILGFTYFKLKQYSDSLANNQAALAIFQEIGARSHEAEALKNLAELHQALGEVDVARQYCQQALALATDLGIPLQAECETLLEALGKGERL